MTYTIVAVDKQTGEVGGAFQSQAFAGASKLLWSLPGYGFIATQAISEPMYGAVGLELLRAGFDGDQTLSALLAVDDHAERRQVAVVDKMGGMAIHTGGSCLPAAGHQLGQDCAALGNVLKSESVWGSMVDAYEAASGSIATRLMSALLAGESAGGDARGQRSAGIMVVKSDRSSHPWRDRHVDLRVEQDTEPLRRLNELLEQSIIHSSYRAAYLRCIDGDIDGAVTEMHTLAEPNPLTDPDPCVWRAIVLGAAGQLDDARTLLSRVARVAPEFVEHARRYREMGIVSEAALPDSVFP